MTNIINLDKLRRQAACKQANEDRRAGQSDADITLILWEESQYDDMQAVIKSAGYQHA